MSDETLVIPAKAGIQSDRGELLDDRVDSRFRGNDGDWADS